MGKTIKETLDVMSGAKQVKSEPKVREKKEHSREGKTLRQLCNVTPGYKPERCSNCGCTRKFSPCTCARKAQP